MSKKPAVLIDRDDTIMIDKVHLTDPNGVELFPDSARAVKKLNDSGILVIIITNQSVIGRGLCTHDRLKEIHDRLKEELKKEGARIDDIFYCPHKPEDNCECRKPGNKLLEDAIKKWSIDRKRCFMVGDGCRDILAGKKSGLKTILVRKKDSLNKCEPNKFFENLEEAAEYIIKSIYC